MPKRSTLRLTKRIVDGLKPGGKDAIFWDRDLAGFGVRVHATGRKLYIVQSRGPAGLKRATLGPAGDRTVEERRREAAAAIDRIKRGEDPKPPEPAPEPTVARSGGTLSEEPCRRALQAEDGEELPEVHRAPHPAGAGQQGAEGCRAGGCRQAPPPDARHAGRGQPGDLGALEDVLAGRELGDGPARMQSVPACPPLPRDAPRALPDARRVPAHRRNAEGVRDRGLDAALRHRGDPPADADRLPLGRDPHPAMGRHRPARRGSCGSAISKTGPRMVPLTGPVLTVLDGIEREDDIPWVFRGAKPKSRLACLSWHWRRVRKAAGLDDVRLHDCRHSYASRALALGEGLPVIGRLLGHARVGTTAKYAHLVRDAEKAAAARTGTSIAAWIMPGDAEAA